MTDGLEHALDDGGLGRTIRRPAHLHVSGYTTHVVIALIVRLSIASSPDIFNKGGA